MVPLSVLFLWCAYLFRRKRDGGSYHFWARVRAGSIRAAVPIAGRTTGDLLRALIACNELPQTSPLLVIWIAGAVASDSFSLGLGGVLGLHDADFASQLSDERRNEIKISDDIRKAFVLLRVRLLQVHELASLNESERFIKLPVAFRHVGSGYRFLASVLVNV